MVVVGGCGGGGGLKKLKNNKRGEGRLLEPLDYTKNQYFEYKSMRKNNIFIICKLSNSVMREIKSARKIKKSSMREIKSARNIKKSSIREIKSARNIEYRLARN